MKELSAFIKARVIPYKYLSEETGYTKGYISRIMTGRSPPNARFEILFSQALYKYVTQDLLELNKIGVKRGWKQCQ